MEEFQRIVYYIDHFLLGFGGYYLVAGTFLSVYAYVLHFLNTSKLWLEAIQK